MKRFAMAFVALSTTFPAMFLYAYVITNIDILILLGLLLSWSIIEFYIGFTKTFKDESPRTPIIMITEMVWLFFIIYSWIDFRFHFTTINLPSLLVKSLLLICLLGLLIRLWAIIHLGNSFTYDVISPGSGKFISSGPYRIIRHPAYLGILIIASLPGLILGSILGFIGMFVTTIVPIYIRMRMEDDILEISFGNEYTNYKKSTSKIIPFIY